MEKLNIIYGKNATLELLKNKKRSVNKIIISKGLNKDTKIDEIILLAKENNIMFQFVPKEKFTQYKEFNHQGVIAYVAPISYTDFHDFLEKPAKNQHKKVIILDGVEDPHNLGAIARTAACAGFDAIIISQHRSTLCTATVEKTSAGAINYIDIIKVNSLSNAVNDLKKSDFWVIAAEANGKDNYFEVDYTGMNFAIIMGAEHSGVSRTLIKQADFLVKIPMFNDFNSLNVSNATSIIIYEATKQIMQKSNLNI